MCVLRHGTWRRVSGHSDFKTNYTRTVSHSTERTYGPELPRVLKVNSRFRWCKRVLAAAPWQSLTEIKVVAVTPADMDSMYTVEKQEFSECSDTSHYLDMKWPEWTDEILVTSHTLMSPDVKIKFKFCAQQQALLCLQVDFNRSKWKLIDQQWCEVKLEDSKWIGGNRQKDSVNTFLMCSDRWGSAFPRETSLPIIPVHHSLASSSSTTHTHREPLCQFPWCSVCGTLRAWETDSAVLTLHKDPRGK